MQGDAMGSWLLQLAAMCAFMLAFSMSWAGIFWVLLSELFSMSVKSPALAAAMAALFLTGACREPRTGMLP
jgi:Sugar (and other) transporter